MTELFFWMTMTSLLFQLIMTLRLFQSDHDVALISSWSWRHAYFQLIMTLLLFTADHDVTPDLLRATLETEPTYMNEAAEEAVEDQPSYANENVR